MKEGWKYLLNDEKWFGAVMEMYRRAVTQHGYKFLPPLIHEVRTRTDGYTTLALITLGQGWVHGYGVTVKGPSDRWSEEEGVRQAIRKAFDNAIIILKQKENHDRIVLARAIGEQAEKQFNGIKDLKPHEVEDRLRSLGITPLA